MKPLMYGYLRVDLVGDRVQEWEERIRFFAEREGFDLGMVFHERDRNRGAFAAMIHELQRAESRHVVVPSMLHVWGVGDARHELVSRLWHEAGAGVWVADPQANRIEVRAAERHLDRSGGGAGIDRDADEIRLAPSPSSVTSARLQVRCILSRWQLAELQAPVERIVSELFLDMVRAEAAEDPSGLAVDEDERPIVVRLRRTEFLCVEVWDTRSPKALATPVNQRVVALSVRCGRRNPEVGGTLLWCELPIVPLHSYTA